MSADIHAPAEAAGELISPPVIVAPPAPAVVIDPEQMRALGQKLTDLFGTYRADRRIAELRWLRNQRQYLGIYDPEIEKQLSANRSRAYPRITRIKCISVLSRIMNLMFPGNEDNWDLQASPSPDMSPDDVMQAINTYMTKAQEAGVEMPLDEEAIEAAVNELATERAEELKELIRDQLQEVGGDQTYDYIALNRKVLQSGIIYGPGLLVGPYVQAENRSRWEMDPMTGPQVVNTTVYKPMFEFLPIWDFYPDMSAKTLEQMDGYFIRKVMSRAQVRKLADREGFFGDVIRKYLSTHSMGNYRAQLHEVELRAMGVKVNVNEMKTETSKYEILIWNGPIDGHFLANAGVDVPEELRGDDIESEIWILDGNVIKAQMNQWRALGTDVKTLHAFIFDEDDTSPVGNGLPFVIRDSQMTVAAATRMLLDNASVVCGPNLECNTQLLRADQDLTSIAAYKIWYRDDDGPTANFPAVRNVQVDAHLPDLLQVIELGLKFADAETFVGPMSGGDQDKVPSEPMRTAAGASMLRSDAALPFKDVIRAFDRFTQSVIYSLVHFNKLFNPSKSTEGDYDVVARGATSLIAKEVRGMQLDQLAQTLQPEDRAYLDEEKFLKERLIVRDCEDLMLTGTEAMRRKAQLQQQQAEQQELMRRQIEADVRKSLSGAFKDIAQASKNQAMADAASVNSAIMLLEKGLEDDTDESGSAGGAGEEDKGEGSD
jgi:hypothetical protein